MENSVLMMWNGGFIFVVCLIREWPAIRHKRDFDWLYVWAALISGAMFVLGLTNLIMGGSNAE